MGAFLTGAAVAREEGRDGWAGIEAWLATGGAGAGGAATAGLAVTAATATGWLAVGGWLTLLTLSPLSTACCVVWFVLFRFDCFYSFGEGKSFLRTQIFSGCSRSVCEREKERELTVECEWRELPGKFLSLTSFV